MLVSPTSIKQHLAAKAIMGKRPSRPPRAVAKLMAAQIDKVTINRDPKPPKLEKSIYLGLSGTFVLAGALVSSAAGIWTAGLIFLLPAAFCFARAFHKP